MIYEFTKFCEELFPSISPYTAESVRSALRQFQRQDGILKFTSNKEFSVIRQGDFFTEIPFYHLNLNGKAGVKKYKALLLTNTCDTTRSDYLTFVAALPIKDFGDKKIDDLKSNRIFRFLHIPGETTEDYVMDLGLLAVVPRTIFETAIQEKKISRIVSLSTIGYYLFISKLTIFFMRPEDKDAYRSRDSKLN
jgi:hypothetical protein